MDTYGVKLTFTEPLLGTVALDLEVYQSWIASNAPDAASLEEEIETLGVEEVAKQGMTGFHRLNGVPVIYDYVLKGFFKDACSMLRRVPKTLSSKITAHKKVIDGLLFVTPRRIPLDLSGGEMSTLERPLRAQTAQGERIALACSEMAPIGSAITFAVQILGGVTEELLREWLDYGALRGLGQWRNAGYGRFSYELVAEK